MKETVIHTLFDSQCDHSGLQCELNVCTRIMILWLVCFRVHIVHIINIMACTNPSYCGLTVIQYDNLTMTKVCYSVLSIIIMKVFQSLSLATLWCVYFMILTVTTLFRNVTTVYPYFQHYDNVPNLDCGRLLLWWSSLWPQCAMVWIQCIPIVNSIWVYRIPILVSPWFMDLWLSLWLHCVTMWTQCFHIIVNII